MRLLFRDSDSGEIKVFRSYKDASRCTGLKYWDVRKDPRFTKCLELYIVRDDGRYRVCQREEDGTLRELISNEPVYGNRKMIEATELMYSERPEEHKRVMKGKAKDLPGGYRVYSSGVVVGPLSPEGLKVQSDGCVIIDGERVKVARLVAEAFLPKIVGFEYVRHKDGDKSNNRVENLCWDFEPELRRKTMAVMRSQVDGRNAVMYESVKKAAAARGVSVQAIYQFIWGKKEDAQGYIWQYYSE